MLNSAFLYSFQSNKETENQMFKIGLGRIGCLRDYIATTIKLLMDGNKNYDDLVPMSMAI